MYFGLHLSQRQFSEFCVVACEIANLEKLAIGHHAASTCIDDDEDVLVCDALRSVDPANRLARDLDDGKLRLGLSVSSVKLMSSVLLDDGFEINWP